MISLRSKDIARQKQANALCANLVQSYEAAHLMITVTRLREKGVHHFATVHDNYGTHACHVDLMHEVLRQAFVELYAGDILRDLLAS